MNGTYCFRCQPLSLRLNSFRVRVHVYFLCVFFCDLYKILFVLSVKKSFKMWYTRSRALCVVVIDKQNIYTNKFCSRSTQKKRTVLYLVVTWQMLVSIYWRSFHFTWCSIRLYFLFFGTFNQTISAMQYIWLSTMVSIHRFSVITAPCTKILAQMQ